MSVIPLTIEGPNPTVVTTTEAFEKAGGVLKGSAAFIRHHDPEQFRPSANSNVSYDLRIGEEYGDHRKPREKKTIPERGVMTLEPGAALMIRTEESVHLPCSMFGIIVPKVTLLQQGISNTFSKVDPGYDGHLYVTLFNLGKTTVTLTRSEPFCALTLFEVRAGARPYDKGEKEIPGEFAKQPRPSWWIFLEVHHVLVTVALIVATVMLFLMEGCRFFFGH